MAKSADTPEYKTTHFSNRGKLVNLGEYLVPESVETFMTGGGKIDSRKWPDLRFKFAIRNGAAVCVGLNISSKPGDRPIQTSLLKSFSIDELAKEAFEAHAIQPISIQESIWTNPGDENVSMQIRPLVNAGYTNREIELKHVARIYCDPQYRKTPANNVERLLGYKSPETANHRIRDARKAGYIPPVRSSKEVLDKAFEVLMEELNTENPNG